MPSYRAKICRPDAKGYYRPEVAGVRFNVGHKSEISEGEAQRRRDALCNLFNKQQADHGLERWAGWALPYAKQIAAGKPLQLVVSDYARSNPGQASEEALHLDRLRQLGINAETTDPETIARGEQQLQRFVEEEVQRAVEKAVAELARRWPMSSALTERVTSQLPDPSQCELRTFHTALQEYRAHLEKTAKRQDNGKLAPSPRNYMRWAKQLESETEDFPLWQLDRTKLDELIAYWRNRPVSKKTKQAISVDHAKHMIDAIWSVAAWLDDSPRWKWELPKGASKINRSPVSLHVDRTKSRARRVSGRVYTVEQLTAIAKVLGPLERLILGLSVNCAMQPAECGRIDIADFYEIHPETNEVGGWILFDRPKTHEYGEWLLWTEVADLVRWGIHRAKLLNSNLLIIQDDGRPWYRDDWGNPCAKFSKWWQGNPTKSDSHIGVVTKLSTEVDGFPRHTIKSLRKILPNLFRPHYGQEIADLVNARKVDLNGVSGKRETDRYSDRPYAKVAEAIRAFEPQFRPFLDVLASTVLKLP